MSISLNPPLATFLAIHRAGSISAACDVLHLSQPAITRRLQTLERQLGAPLFDRMRTGLRLSSVGEALLPHAERACAAELDGLRAVADHLAGESGRVTLGVVGSLATSWLTDVLAAVLADHPSVDLVVSTATSRQIRDQVLRGDLAVGISYACPTDVELDVRVLFHEALVVVGAANHRCAGRRVRIDDLRADWWPLFPELPPQPESSGTIARRLLEQHQVPDESIRPIDSLSAQRALASAGHGLAFVPESAIADDVAAGRLAVLDVTDVRITAPVTMMIRRGAYVSGATRGAHHPALHLTPAGSRSRRPLAHHRRGRRWCAKGRTIGACGTPRRPDSTSWTRCSTHCEPCPGSSSARRGVFYRRSHAFLHFHEDPTGLHADVRFDEDFERYPSRPRRSSRCWWTACARCWTRSGNGRCLRARRLDTARQIGHDACRA